MTKIQNNNFSVLNYNEIVYNDLKKLNKYYSENQHILFVICTDKNSKIYNYVIAIEKVDTELNIQYSIARCPIEHINPNILKDELDKFTLDCITTILKEQHDYKDNNRKIDTEESST